jgi:thiol-disulfide isomerase/thioredoxin
MKRLIGLVLLLSSTSVFATPAVPDFTVQVGQQQYAKMRGWILNFLPPKGHHFNTDAPMSITALNQIIFIKGGATPEHVGFRSSDQKLIPGTEVAASIFLCDDAKTYCIKKTLTFALNVNSDLKSLDFAPVPTPADKSKSLSPKKAGKKDEHAFWDNNVGAALAEAVKTKKPILIDFYGIWCPPCNQFNETVFPSREFKAAAKNWVLLKLDADAEESFALKSNFKIGGYPTLLALKAPTSATDITALSEIDRVVGYYPTKDFMVLFNKAYANRAESLDEKFNSTRAAYLQGLKDIIAVKIEQKETKQALALVLEGKRLTPTDSFFNITELSLKSSEKPEVLKEPARQEILKAIWTNRAGKSVFKRADSVVKRCTRYFNSESGCDHLSGSGR